MTHNLKILSSFADAVLNGDKNFEIRDNNDRGFQKGDLVKFKVIDNLGLEEHHSLNFEMFEITYVLSGWGLKEGYVVFGIKRRTKNEN